MAVTDTVPAATEASAVRPRVRERSPVRAAVAVGIPTAVLVAHTAVYGQWIEDDAGITFAYARSLATGAGPVLQPGAVPVEGYSNPAWLAVLVLGRWLGLFDRGELFGQPDLVLFPKIVAAACCVGVFAAFHAVARAVSSRPVIVTAAAGTLTALVPSFVIWTTSGLENGLYALLVVALAAALARAAVDARLLTTRTAVLCGALAGIAALTRPDGLVHAAAYPLAVLLALRRDTVARSARTAVLAVTASAAPVGLYLAVRLATFGDWLPNTARAKAQGLPGVERLSAPADLIGYAGWLTALVAAGLVALAAGHRSRTRTAVAMLLVPTALSVTAFAVLAPDWMAQYRFATPVWPLGALVATLAAAHVWSAAGTRARAAGLVATVLALALSASAWVNAAVAFRDDPTAPMCFVARSVGQRVNGYADILGVREGSLLAVDGGGTALTTRLRFVDLSGLADARMARLWSADDMAGLRDVVYDVERPTFVKVDAGWWDGERSGILADPRLERDYVVLLAPGPGTATWVRRDAVPDAAALAEARAYARRMLVLADVRYLREDLTDWPCASTLRPPGP